jgi:hypothetical protein
LACVVLGLAALGAAAQPLGGAPDALRWNAGIAGVLALAGGLTALRLGIPARSFSLLGADGMVLMEVTAVEFRGRRLALKGKMMGAMPTVAYVGPEEVAKALRLISPAVVLRMPALLCRALAFRPSRSSLRAPGSNPGAPAGRSPSPPGD